MRFVDDSERAVLRAVAGLTDGNPFLPERVANERQALGPAFVKTADVWRVDAELEGLNPNLPKLNELVLGFADRLRGRLADGAKARRDELEDYQSLVGYLLYYRYESEFVGLMLDAAAGRPTTRKLPAYARYRRDFAHYLEAPGVRLPAWHTPAHIFAIGYQTRRAFHHTFRQIFGGSMPAARLRAAVWQSIFTHDVRRYRRALWNRMDDAPTLVIGESGTGKELVARAIGLSRYIPFDERSQAFAEDYARSFHAVALSALSPTLIESELFGHRRGAFTGAVEDREGWLEACGPCGSVFLDEIGELDAAIQVKLLRLLQTRVFQRIGETRERRFRGKVVAATHRDLAREMERGRFRPDLYYRLCADLVRTPSLREQLADAPAELAELARVLARRIAGEDEADALTDEVVRWVERELGADYPWPGNVRELEQCVRNVMVRGAYRPVRAVEGPGGADARGGDGEAALLRRMRAGELPAEALLRHYCTLVYARAGSYEEAARRLGLDRRTVKSRIDPTLLAALQAGDRSSDGSGDVG